MGEITKAEWDNFVRRKADCLGLCSTKRFGFYSELEQAALARLSCNFRVADHSPKASALSLRRIEC